MKALLIALVASAAIPASFAQTFAQRWDDDVAQLKAVQAPIPYVQLHAYVLKILRDRIVAKDDEQLDRPRDAKADRTRGEP